MKKRAIGILCMLLCVCFLSASAQETQVDEFFRCQVGQISFVLPGYPQIFHEEDLPARELQGTYMAWQNKIQLNGSGAMNGEFQVHIADLTPSIEWMREERPDEEEVQYQYNALMNMISFYLAIHNGSVSDDVSAHRVKSDDRYFPVLSFSYSYPDAPGVKYQGRAFMDGTLAVVMMVEADAGNLAALEDMHVVSAEEAAAFLQEDPHTVTAGRLQLTFPEAPLATVSEGHCLYEAFTPDFGYVSVEYMQADLSYMLTNGMDADTLLRTLAESAAQSYQAQGIISEYEIRKLDEGMYAFDAMEIDSNFPEGYGPAASRILAVFTLEGVYTVTAIDTEMGRAFYESVTIVNSAE